MPKLTGRSNLGPMGPEGSQGDPGLDGADGASAYEIAVANGFVGTEAEWLDSLVGPMGEVEEHDHDDRYSLLGHTHAGLYAPLSHSHTTADISSGTFDPSFIPSLPTSKITSGTFEVARIPDIAATKITSGVLDAARLPTHQHSGADITSGTLDAARVPSLDASKITSGTFGLGRIPTGTSSSTVALGNRGVPAGGATNQVLSKSGSTDFATVWREPSRPSVTDAQASNILGITSTTTIVTRATPVLTAGVTYLVEATGWIEGYGGGGSDSTGRIRIVIDGTNTDAPIDEFFIAGVHYPKVQYASAIVTGSGATVATSLAWVHASGSTSVRWAKLVVRVTPI